MDIAIGASFEDYEGYSLFPHEGYTILNNDNVPILKSLENTKIISSHFSLNKNKLIKLMDFQLLADSVTLKKSTMGLYGWYNWLPNNVFLKLRVLIRPATFTFNRPIFSEDETDMIGFNAELL